MPAPVLIDTDPGLDDALALFLVCASPELEVIGVTTVAGNIGLSRTTTNALKLLHHLGRDDIPVIAGCAEALRRGAIEAAPIHGEDGLGGADLALPERQPLAADATAWLADELLRRPAHSLQILALGPLTNLARLVERNPDAASRLAGIVAMGGAVREGGNVTKFAEFNIAADPEAAAIVLGAGIPVTLVPLDVTRKVLADRARPDRSLSLEPRGTPFGQKRDVPGHDAASRSKVSDARSLRHSVRHRFEPFRRRDSRDSGRHRWVGARRRNLDRSRRRTARRGADAG
jgi:inosine-uridine nucleoside N-ribohydrolase